MFQQFLGPSKSLVGQASLRCWVKFKSDDFSTVWQALKRQDLSTSRFVVVWSSFIIFAVCKPRRTMGKLVNVTSRASALLQLSASIVSVITCSIIIYSISLDQKTLKKSYHLRLVQRLLLSSIGLSVAIIVYYIMAASLDNTALSSYCNFHIPVIVYFFLCSFGWTAMLAYRFRLSHSETKKLAAPPVSMWVVWTAPLLFSGTVLLAAFITDQVTTVEASSVNTNKTCTFDHDSNTGIYVDLITYQAPLLLTILINCYSYGKGLYYLRNTPQSVLARQMKKAGGYLAVLLVVWVPNFVYNILTMFDGSDPEYNGFLDLVIFFNSLQVDSNRPCRALFTLFRDF